MKIKILKRGGEGVLIEGLFLSLAQYAGKVETGPGVAGWEGNGLGRWSEGPGVAIGVAAPRLESVFHPDPGLTRLLRNHPRRYAARHYFPFDQGLAAPGWKSIAAPLRG